MDARERAAYLLSRFDIDPTRVKPMWYGCNISVPIVADGLGRGSVTMNNQPFMAARITHAVLGATFDWQTTGLYQDGQYLINFKDEMHNYQNIPLQSEVQFGPNRTGHYLDFKYPLFFAGTSTVSFEVTNLYARVLSPESDYYTVQLCIHGVADWGPYTQPTR